jgi:hypothetical protein
VRAITVLQHVMLPVERSFVTADCACGMYQYIANLMMILKEVVLTNQPAALWHVVSQLFERQSKCKCKHMEKQWRYQCR